MVLFLKKKMLPSYSKTVILVEEMREGKYPEEGGSETWEQRHNRKRSHTEKHYLNCSQSEFHFLG